MEKSHDMFLVYVNFPLILHLTLYRLYLCSFMQGVLDRFTQIQPKVIFSVEAVRYNGKMHNHMEKLKQVVNGLPGLKKVILFPFCSSEHEHIHYSDIPNW